MNLKKDLFETNHINCIGNTNIINKNNLSNLKFQISEIYDSYLNCKANKKSINVLKFEEKLEENLFSLYDDINFGNYAISRAICFVVEKPKIREIWASDFRDRVVHHLITRKIEKCYENTKYSFSFLDNSYANRKFKGTHLAVKKLKDLSKANIYYLKLDIKSFFNSIDRNLLFEILKSDLEDIEIFQKENILVLFKKIIFHKYTSNYYKKSSEELFKLVPYDKSLFYAEKFEKGLPIGNLTSQFLSNVYLNKLDYFIIKELKFNNYIRYVDDFVILSNDYDELKNSINKIELFLKNNLELELHSNKIVLNETINGINFLGYYIKPKYTLVRKNVVNNLKEKLYYFLNSKLVENKLILTYNDINKIQNIVNSYFGHFKHAKSYNLKFKMGKKLTDYFLLEKNSDKNIIIKPKFDLNFKNVISQYNYFLNKYPNCLIVFQMGNFYRFFNQQALYISSKIDLKIQIKKYSGTNYDICGFPINSKKFLEKIEKLNINYVIVKQLENILSSGLKERIESEIILDKNNLIIDNYSKKTSFEDLNSILKWDLNSMTPIEVFIKLNNLVDYINKNGNKK